jgi:hypothetical protein
VTYSGDLQFTTGFNVNGIETLRGGRRLVVVQIISASSSA